MPRAKAIKTLAEIPASELALSARPLIQIDSSAPLDDALTLLRHNNVLALPVFDLKKNKYVGIVSVSDILNYIAFFDFTRDGKIAEKFDNGSRPVSDLLGLSAESKRLWVTDVTDSIDDLLEPMSKGVHRVLVRLPADQESHLPAEAGSTQKSSETSLNDFAESQFRIVTQSDLLRFVCSRLDSLEGLKVPFNHSLKHLGLSSGKVSVMKSSDTAIQGFSRMAKEEVSSLAIVDDNGRLVACLSVSDLRGITSNLISRLLLPVLDFLKEKNRGILPPVIAVTDQFSLKEVLTKMIVCKVHRIFIEDGFNFKPTGVITMTDIITTLYNNEYVQ